MKKFVAIMMVLAVIMTIPAVAELTYEECNAYAETWRVDEANLSDYVKVMECFIRDETHNYHVTIIAERASLTDTFGGVQWILSGPNGWLGSWYSHNEEQAKEDFIEVVNWVYEGTL